MCPTALGRKEKKLSNVHIVHWETGEIVQIDSIPYFVDYSASVV